jgi:5-methylcytosine-specific restriction endonuclease McrA
MTYIPEARRQAVTERAKQKCEYCLLDEKHSIYSHEIDHIIPEKHRGQTVDSNLCYACLDCNRNKGSDFASLDPVTGEVTLLYNPRQDQWAEHFKLDEAQITPLTAKGRVTVFILKLNDPKRLLNRQRLYKLKRYP